MAADIEMPIDQYITVVISEDKLQAYLQFTAVDAQSTFTVYQLEQFLRSHFIEFGVNNVILAQIAGNPQACSYQKILIALGTAPVEAIDGYIDYKFNLDAVALKPVELEDGSVDYKQVISLNDVLKGQAIAERVLAQDGVIGSSVTGEILIPKKGKEARYKLGKNVITDADHMVLYAGIDGIIAKTDHDKINVFPVFEVNGDVDYNTGNIDFIGTVVVRGNVLTGFRVKAGGDIRITGGVEGAELTAAGSIDIGAGILGHNRGLIKAEVNIRTSFIQDAEVDAGAEVLVSQSIMHSNIRAGQNVVCQGSKGLIVGGLIQAGEKVVARTIGNTISTTTVIEVGVLPELRNKLQNLRNNLKDSVNQMVKTNKALFLLDQMASAGKLNDEKLEFRTKLMYTKKQALNEEIEIRERILDIEKSLENSMKAKVEVVSVVYGGTKIVIGRYIRFIKEPLSKVMFSLADGDVSMAPLD